MNANCANHLTSMEYLLSHEVTRRLQGFGVTRQQLDGIRFRHTNRGWPFDQWSITWPADIPIEAIPALRAFCTLKWLVLEDPPYSRDKEDAWRYVTDAMIAPTLQIGEKTRVAQSLKAKKPRGKITDDGRTMDQVITELAVNPQYRHETAKELWPRLFSVLDEEELDPKEITNGSVSTYTYSTRSGRRKSLKLLRFANVVSEARRKKNSH